MLNALDCWMSLCILILVAGTALYVEPVSKGPHLSLRSMLTLQGPVGMSQLYLTVRECQL